MIRICIADDQELLREGLALILDAQPDMEVVAHASDGVEAIAIAREYRPDVLIMDIRMPRLTGVDATRRIVADKLNTRVLVLTMFDLDEYVYAALRAGASGFLLKDSPRASIIAAVRSVVAGDVLLAPEVTRRLIELYSTAGDLDVAPPGALQGLTDREREVLTHLATGQSNLEIADRLGIGEATVKTHVSRLLAKLGQRDRVQLVVCAYETGVVRPGGPTPRQS
ncbi:response regulator [Angustibacter sp. McL0619]|uniref:response regulator n=1 Tax=Angustibacter sp. McL0619 TaxID=3415676 RepID=UPI003CF10E2A